MSVITLKKMSEEAAEATLARIRERTEKHNEVLRQRNKKPIRLSISKGEDYYVIGLEGDTSYIPERDYEAIEGVDSQIRISKRHKLVSWEYRRLIEGGSPTVIDLGGVEIGGKGLVVAAGPCSVEGSVEEMLRTAEDVKAAGAQLLRGGAFKPRTSPYSAQGLGERGLKILRELRDKTGLLTVTESTGPENLDLVLEYADCVQIGARNCQSYNFLEQVAKKTRNVDKPEKSVPILLKRGMMTTIDEFLNAAEYLMLEGNPNIILCVRGVRGFETSTRNMSDIDAIPVLLGETHLPVWIDPSHMGGRRELVYPLAVAGVATGASGILVEAYTDPEKASSDGFETVYSRGSEKRNQLGKILEDCRSQREIYLNHGV